MLDGPLARSQATTRVARACAALFGVALSFGLGACGASNAADSGQGSGGTTSGGMSGTGTGGSGGLSFTLGLDLVSPDDGHELDPAQLPPNATANLLVSTYPPATHTVRFAFLGTPLDAVLSSTFVDTDPDTGTSAITLTAPSAPAAFSVRASSPGASAITLDLAVEETNMASLSIKPSYQGERVLHGYVASATPDLSCADLPAGSPPDDGPLSAPMSDQFPIDLEVPTGRKLAVMLRAEKSAWGCTTLSGVSEGAENKLEIVIENVPMKLDASMLGFELDLDSFDDFDQALAGATDALVSGVLGNASDDVEALLDAMSERADDSSFADDRKKNGWDDAVRDALGANAAEALRGPLGRWLQAGLTNLPASGGLTGALTGTMSGPPSVSLDSVFGLSAADSGFTPSGTASWEAGADDRVVIGMSMALDPAAFLLAQALAPAQADVPDAEDLAGALAESAPCGTVAAALVAAGVKRGRSTANCDADCTERLCDDAVGDLVAALDTGSADATLDVALTASGTVGDDAELTSFSGRWLGRFTTPDGSSSLTGAAMNTPAQ